MNPRLDALQEYPFQRLGRLLANAAAPEGKSKILMSLGEPRHAPPDFIHDILASGGELLSGYPVTRGETNLRTAIAGWLVRRFGLPDESIDPERHVLPTSGSREAIFSFIQAAVGRRAHSHTRVAMPNPFYQIYEGATLMAGGTPYFLNTLEENDWLPDLDRVPDEIWDQTQLLLLCSPDNPTGAVIPAETYRHALDLAERHDFIVAADECYCELYRDESSPPAGLLQVAADSGNDGYERCIVFHSLSKRSNLPGLRSGFVAGNADLLDAYFKYRTYHGCVPNRLTQAISTAAWNDDEHVALNRDVYRDKFSTAIEILEPVLKLNSPAAGFYLWPQTPQDDETFARDLYAAEHVVTLPGRYLARDTANGNPGRNRVRMALVAEPEICAEAARRIRSFIERSS